MLCFSGSALRRGLAVLTRPFLGGSTLLLHLAQGFDFFLQHIRLRFRLCGGRGFRRLRFAVIENQRSACTLDLLFCHHDLGVNLRENLLELSLTGGVGSAL